MSVNSSNCRSGKRGFLARLCRYGRDRRGNIGVITALLLIPLIGTMGIAAETSSWYMFKRNMQNAADSAAIAYATNGDFSVGGTGRSEARAVAAKYGYVDDANTTIAFPPVVNLLCTGGSCPSVSITKKIPIYLAKIIGYGGSPAGYQTIAVSAVAKTNPVATSYCLFALSNINGTNIATGGVNKCDIRANGNASCGALDLNPGFDVAATPQCGGQLSTNTTPLQPDPNGNLSTSPLLGANGCGSYSTNPLPSNALAAHYCGDVQLTADVTINDPSAILLIVNGNLDLNGHRLQTTSGAGLTIIFTGLISSPAHQVVGSGTLDIAAPTSGDWSGVAIYQYPAMTGSTVTVGSPPATWDITGLVYYPQSTVTLAGPISGPASQSPYLCFVLEASSITVSGGGIYPGATGNCGPAGRQAPTDTPSATNQRIVLIQ